MLIELPWPNRVLNPNARVHWSKIAKAKKLLRRDCYYIAKMQKVPNEFKFSITFHPPDNRKRDRDNYIAAFKAGQDGLADAWGVDDSIFEITYKPLSYPVKNGAVIIEFY